MSVKKWVVFFCGLIVMVGFFGCGNQKSKDKKYILDNYSDDLSYVLSQPQYFLPLTESQNFLSVFRSFDLSTEYDETILEMFSPDYIRSNIHEIYSVFLSSEKCRFVIQFPNRKIFDKQVAKLEETPQITKDALKKLLKFEYRAEISNGDIELESANYSDTREYATFNGEQRYWISDNYYSYFVSDDFTQDMNVFSAWITGEKWNDLNSTIFGGPYYIYTFDPANDLPVIHNIDKVALLDSELNTCITQTGYYKFEVPDNGAEIETYENGDGSLDIMFGMEGNGIRVFLSGAVAEIDQLRRVIPKM